MVDVSAVIVSALCIVASSIVAACQAVGALRVVAACAVAGACSKRWCLECCRLNEQQRLRRRSNCPCSTRCTAIIAAINDVVSVIVVSVAAAGVCGRQCSQQGAFGALRVVAACAVAGACSKRWCLECCRLSKQRRRKRRHQHARRCGKRRHREGQRSKRWCRERRRIECRRRKHWRDRWCRERRRIKCRRRKHWRLEHGSRRRSCGRLGSGASAQWTAAQWTSSQWTSAQ